MFKSCIKLALTVATISSVGFSGSVMAADTKIGKITGRINSQYTRYQKKSEADATTTTEGGIYTDARFGWTSTFTEGEWKARAKFEIDIQEYGSGVSKTSESDKFIITHRDKYIYLDNGSIRILMGYAWNHLNGGVQGGEYQNFNSAGTQNSLKFYGVNGSRVEALAITLKTFDAMNFKLILSEGSDGMSNWHDVGTKKTDDTGLGLAFSLNTDDFELSALTYQVSSKGNEDRDSGSDGYTLDTSAVAVGFLWKDLIDNMNPFVNYQLRTSKDNTGKTGDGFTRMELGVDYALGDDSGVTATFNTKTTDNEDTDQNYTEETIGATYTIKISNVSIGAGLSSEKKTTDTDSWIKENRIGANLHYLF